MCKCVCLCVCDCMLCVCMCVCVYVKILSAVRSAGSIALRMAAKEFPHHKHFNFFTVDLNEVRCMDTHIRLFKYHEL